MGSNTTRGSYRIDAARTLSAFDRMPAGLREIVRNCLYDYAVPPLLNDLKRGADVMTLIDSLMQHDVSEARRDAKRDWKKQADAYLAAQRTRKRRDWHDRPPRARL